MQCTKEFRITLILHLLKKNNYSINDSVKIFIDDEYSLGLDKIEFYHKFSTNIIKLKKNLIELLLRLKNENKSIFGYGASAKGNVLLNFCDIANENYSLVCTCGKSGL